MWLNYFDHRYVINLERRTDRMQQISGVLKKYSISYQRIEAIDNKENPRKGLVDTMKRIFKTALGKGLKHVMILEDDATPLVEKDVFHDTMNCCIKQLPGDWDIFYLGCNVSQGLKPYSENLFWVKGAYATHAACYSKKAMQFIVSSPIAEPVDNFIVREFQTYNNIFCSYPMLMTQVPGHSDIGGNHTDWGSDLEKKFEEHVKQLPK